MSPRRTARSTVPLPRRSWGRLLAIATAGFALLAASFPSTALAAGTLTFGATADAYTVSTASTTNYGSATSLRARSASASYTSYRSYLRFDLSGTGGSVTSAKLRLYDWDPSTDAGTVYRVSDTWSETGITWANAPTFGSVLSRGGAVTGNTWVEFDVTAAVTGDGSYSFGLSNGTSDGAYYNSREATANRPQLVVTSGTTPPPSGSAVLVGAGDIADCAALTGAQKTADLISGILGTVFADGDNAYPNGTPADYTDCYGPTWGAFKSRTKPALGNHEYYSSSTAAGYFGYFGSVAGQPSKGYYSYDLGSWHIVVLNSNCSKIEGGNACASTSPQLQWLRADLAGHAAQCTLAYWHHPRFSSGSTTGSSAYDPFWRALYDYGAEVVINGHAHIYERFAPQSPVAAADPRGIREFIVGTGGASLSGISTVRANSEVRDNSSFGVLKLTLGSGTYSWEFIPAAGYSFRDSGSGSCH